MRPKAFITALLLALSLAWQPAPPVQSGGTQMPSQAQDKTPSNPDMFDPLMPPIKIVPPDECQKVCAQQHPHHQRRQTICNRVCNKNTKKTSDRMQ